MFEILFLLFCVFCGIMGFGLLLLIPNMLAHWGADKAEKQRLSKMTKKEIEEEERYNMLSSFGDY